MSRSHSLNHGPREAGEDPFPSIFQTFEKLEKLCCDPDRSPAMAELGSSLDAARSRYKSALEDSDQIGDSLANFKDAASQLATLQVGCCAPARMPLYAEILRNLNSAQVDLSRSAGPGH